MKKLLTTFSMLLMAAIFTCAYAQGEKKTEGKQMTPEEKAWMIYMTPGKYHEMLAKDNGTWTEDLTMWMDPAAPPTKSTATCENMMILGGRYQQSVHKGMFNGMPFEGISTVGYDNAKKVYVSTWVDNMGSGIMYMEGPYNESTKTVTFRGKQVDPMTGKEMEVMENFKFVDDSHQEMEMYMIKEGKRIKTMEIKFAKQ